jgi:hypothetical protein
VADRGNSRVQIFNQDGRFLDQWRQFGRPRGIYMGSAKTGKVSAMIPFVEPDPDANNNAGNEGIAADTVGNVFGGQTTGLILHKYVKGAVTSKLASGAAY